MIVVLRCRLGTGRGLADDGQDRALDGLADGRVGELGATGQGVGEVEAVEAALAVEAFGDPPADLGDDHARSSREHPSASPRLIAAATRPADLAGDRFGLVQRDPDGCQHVRAGIAVGHRERRSAR